MHVCVECGADKRVAVNREIYSLAMMNKVCVFFALNRYVFLPIDIQHTRVRADSSSYQQRYKLCGHYTTTQRCYIVMQ